MKSAVIVFPGSNCDRDLAVAFSEISGRETHMVWHGDSDLPDGIDVIGVPGGFSYGDYLRSGAMAARSPIMRAVVKARSEEHTSELQSLMRISYAVFCLKKITCTYYKQKCLQQH